MSLMHPDEQPVGQHAYACGGMGYVANFYAITPQRRQRLALIVLRECLALTWLEIAELLAISESHALRSYRKARLRLFRWATGNENGEGFEADASANGEGFVFWQKFKCDHGVYAAAVFVLALECEFNLSQIGEIFGKNRGTMSRTWNRLVSNLQQKAVA